MSRMLVRNDDTLEQRGLKCRWCLPQATSASCVARKKTRGGYPYAAECPLPLDERPEVPGQ